MKAVIEEIVVQPNKAQPIMVDFQVGRANYDTKNVSCGLYHDQSQDKTVLALSTGKNVYKGYKPKISSMRTMLALRNKSTGKVRLIEVERWQIAPVFGKVVAEENEDDEENKTNEDFYNQLTKEFGSKKGRRTVEFREMIRHSFGNLNNNNIEKVALGTELKNLDLTTSIEESVNSLLPTCNRSANNVKDVYNVYDLIPKSKLETLHEHSLKVLDGEVERKDKFFVQTLRSIQSDPDKVNKVALLLYIEMINAWFTMSLKDAKKRNVVVCEVSKEVNQHIIDMYSISSTNGRLRPNWMKDKAVIHSLILALTILNFKLDLEQFQLMIQIRISFKKLVELAKIIGAVPSKEDKKIITLQVPLPAPMSLVKKNRRRKNML